MYLFYAFCVTLGGNYYLSRLTHELISVRLGSMFNLWIIDYTLETII